MQFDPNNPVVKLCAEGMALETKGQTSEAKALFEEAWQKAGNDFEAFTAAHYLARHQANPDDELYWNQEALARAQKVNDDTMTTHYPSLHLNIGRSFEKLGDKDKARQHYELAGQFSNMLPAGNYSELIRSGISAALKRTGPSAFKNTMLDNLIDSWCEQKALKPLSFILPAHVNNLGTQNDIQRLASALAYLSTAKCLPPHEQQAVEDLVKELSEK